MEDVTASLDGWHFVNGALYGFVIGDKKGRFVDGAFIHTSSLADGAVLEEGSVVRTRNSTYRLLAPLKIATE